MPELPEVESVRRSLERAMLGARVERARLWRSDVVTGVRTPAALLEGGVIESLRRHGKHLAIVAEDGRTLEAHLGMSGVVECGAAKDGAAGIDEAPAAGEHTHAAWLLRVGRRRVLMRFRDPRRFGGLWTFATFDELIRRRWSRLGPDALGVGREEFVGRLRRSGRSLKAALLDQALIAGVGNIYADESLFAAGLSPRRRGRGLSVEEAGRLHAAVVETLRTAVAGGGTTLSDGGYTDADGEAGRHQERLRVYGRSGLPCHRCGFPLSCGVLAGRTTVWCSRCQGKRAGRGTRHRRVG